MAEQKRYSEKDIREHSRKQAASGLSIKAYCAKHGLALSTFWYLRRRFGVGSQATRRKGPGKRIELVKISEGTVSVPSSIEVSFGPVRIRLPQNCDAETLRSVIGAAVEGVGLREERL